LPRSAIAPLGLTTEGIAPNLIQKVENATLKNYSACITTVFYHATYLNFSLHCEDKENTTSPRKVGYLASLSLFFRKFDAATKKENKEQYIAKCFFFFYRLFV